MYAYTNGASQAQRQMNPTGYPPVPVPALGMLTPIAAPSPPFLSSRTPSPVLHPVTVPPGCHPLELVQFWRGEHKRGQPCALHWALFLRTHGPDGARGHFYELAGTPDTYTAQFLQGVTFEPCALPDWRGTHVIGWVSAGEVGVFERVVRQVPVWRHHADWRSQQWVYEVVRAVGCNYPGVHMCDVTFGGLQTQMGRLLEAWERGDI